MPTLPVQSQNRYRPAPAQDVYCIVCHTPASYYGCDENVCHGIGMD